MLFDGDDKDVSEWLSNGVIDIGFKAQLGTYDKLIPLARDKMLAVLLKRHHLAKFSSIPILELLGIPFIISKGGCEPFIRDIFGSVGLKVFSRIL